VSFLRSFRTLVHLLILQIMFWSSVLEHRRCFFNVSLFHTLKCHFHFYPMFVSLSFIRSVLLFVSICLSLFLSFFYACLSVCLPLFLHWFYIYIHISLLFIDLCVRHIHMFQGFVTLLSNDKCLDWGGAIPVVLTCVPFAWTFWMLLAVLNTFNEDDIYFKSTEKRLKSVHGFSLLLSLENINLSFKSLSPLLLYCFTCI
jgi:hypothetical protein